MSVLTAAPGGAAAADASAGTEGAAPPEAAHQHRLHLPHGLASWRFAVIVGGLLAAGMVALLTVNTSLAAGSITLSGLESDLARKTEQQQALEGAVEALASPFALQQSAIALGMVPSGPPAFLDPATGTLSGALEPAPAAEPPGAPAPQVTEPEPEPEPEPALTAGPPPGAPLPAAPDRVQTTPTPEPLPTPDPRSDGARLPSPEQPEPAPSAVPSPAPTPSGDGAAIVPRGDG
jgi:hypothetical protein